MSLLRSVSVGLFVAFAPLHAGAQPTPDSTSWGGASRALVTHRDLALAGVFSAATLVAMPFDVRVTRWLRRPSLQKSPGLSNTATAFRHLGGSGTILIGVATYGTGLAMKNRTLADVGLHTTGALVASSAVGSVMKRVLGRARPYAVADSTSTSYALGRGFTKGSAFQSMPSGHTTAAFAVASVLASESRHRWPRRARIIAPLAYGAASLVALSRIYSNSHWASDVTLGAGIGIVSGYSVVRFQHTHPDNWVDTSLLPSRHALEITPWFSGRSAEAYGVGVTLRF